MGKSLTNPVLRIFGNDPSTNVIRRPAMPPVDESTPLPALQGLVCCSADPFRLSSRARCWRPPRAEVPLIAHNQQ